MKLMTKLRSDITRDGISRTPHRAFMRAMGLDDEAIAKPMIGVVSMKGEQTPCNMTHGFQVEAAKQGIAEAGGTPREFTTISMSDGIGMNHEGMKFSLVSRELIADSIEAVVHGLAYDGLVGFGGCDKTLPGVMMGMLRCNVPAVFIYGGSALPGRFAGRDVTILDSYEAVGAVMTGGMDEATLAQLERSCLPTIGACAGQFTGPCITGGGRRRSARARARRRPGTHRYRQPAYGPNRRRARADRTTCRLAAAGAPSQERAPRQVRQARRASQSRRRHP